MFKAWHILALSACLLAGVACGPSQDEMDQRVQGILSALPTATPIVFPTPLPTPTPVDFPTPLPTPTPVTFPTPLPTATPVLVADFNAVYRGARTSVYFVQTPSGTGSGWALEPDLVLTNQHVVAGAATVTLRHGTNAPVPATVVAVDTPRDIALLRLDTSRARLGDTVEPLQLGQISGSDIARSLMALGYSGRGVNADGTVGGPTANTGVLSGIVRSSTGSYAGWNLLMDAAVDPGDSGGPVLNTDGDVVGMVRAVREQTASGQRVVGTFFAVHVDEIRAALPDLKAGRSR
ncbi:MAG: serine protease [Dehalococcoidia bacterium]|nr:serine protease [Dehalococcoidia bacterium]